MTVHPRSGSRPSDVPGRSTPVVHRSRQLRYLMGPSITEDRSPAAFGPRFLLWVDAVGGFLVCLGDLIEIGQPEPRGSQSNPGARPIDVPILGDLSARHLSLARDGEGYSLSAPHPVQINNQPVVGQAPLGDDCELTVGRGVKLRFRRPHPFSRSASLNPLSRHRTQPTTDGVLLMAESLILGPSPTSHVVCPRWPFDVVLFRRGDALFCRAAGPLEVDGHTHPLGQAPLTTSSHVSGDYFALSLEPL